MQRRLLTLMFLLLTALMFATPALAQQTVRVLASNGRVEYRPPATGAAQIAAAPWVPVEVGMELPLGASISTGFNSRASVAFGAAVISVDPLTRIELTTLVERDGGVDSELFLQVGRVRAEVRSTEGLEQNFRLRSTQATAAVRGTSFTFDGVNVVVLSGLVQAINRFNQPTLVAAGEQTSITSDDARPENPGEARESQLAVVPFVPSGSEERTESVIIDVPPTTGAIEFDLFIQ